MSVLIREVLQQPLHCQTRRGARTMPSVYVHDAVALQQSPSGSNELPWLDMKFTDLCTNYRGDCLQQDG